MSIIDTSPPQRPETISGARPRLAPLVNGSSAHIRDGVVPVAQTIRDTESIDTALVLLRAAEVDYLTVTDTNDAPVGFLTRCAVEQLQQQRPRKWTAIRCGDAITAPLRTLRSEEPFDAAIDILRDQGIRPVLVLDQNEVVGVLEPTTVFQWCAEQRPTALEELALLAGRRNSGRSLNVAELSFT